MTERIKKLVQYTVSGDMRPIEITPDFDSGDMLLPQIIMEGKRECEYILAQSCPMYPESAFTGLFTFNGSTLGDAFSRRGHKNFRELFSENYRKPIENLVCFDWQHCVGNYSKIIENGFIGIMKEIEESRRAHEGDREALDFLETQDQLCIAMIKRAHKCSEMAKNKASETENKEYKANLLKLSEALMRVPENGAESFYEALLILHMIYPLLPDSIGLIDRYLYHYYRNDIEKGMITKETAKEYLQELFLMLQARINHKSDRFYRGGESHFCIGGYLPNGEDGWNELSELIVEALMELPTWIPQISIRWTKKTPREVLRFMLDAERNDPNKRIAFVNDEPRLRGLMKNMELPFEVACEYTMMGCNELALPGGIVFGFDPSNILRSIENTFHKRTDDIIKAKTFEDFFDIYTEELKKDLSEISRIGEKLQEKRAMDNSIVSNMLLDGCIERAKCFTRGGASKYTAVGILIGLSNVIDSLSVTKQFVYDERIVTMKELTDALKANWSGYEELHSLIIKKGKFFGNDDETSNYVAQLFFKTLDAVSTKDNYLGKKWIYGNLIGYNEYHKFFGDVTAATPDGRYAGEMTNFGIGQSGDKDREGLTALLSSVAKCDPENIMVGPSVTNVLLEETLVKNDDSFEKLVTLFETYFKSGGTHFQLTYVSKEDLINAQKEPDKYRNLRVRVSGFSDYFNNLNKGLQDEIITRTVKTK